MRVSLTDPDGASSEDGGIGTWTMIYDEGFEVAVADQVFFAFSKFEYIDGPSKERTNVSHCDQTEIGWYHNAARTQWGCYSGKKVGASGDDSADSSSSVETPAAAPRKRASRLSLSTWSQFKQTALAPDQQDDSADPPADEDQNHEDSTESSQSSENTELAVADAGGDSAAQSDTTDLAANSAVDTSSQSEVEDQAAVAAPLSTTAPQAAGTALTDITAMPSGYKPWVPDSSGYDAPMPPDWQKAVADALNFLQLGWTAGHYYMYTGKTPRELNRFAGVRRSRPRPQHLGQGQQPAPSFLGLGARVSRRSTVDSFDWRNRRGQNWLQPIVTQGDCGSCYAISTVRMLTARNRIHQGDAFEPAFSVSFPLHCSEYNQGCDGGYGFLESKWNEDVGLIPETCAPLKDDGQGSCEALPNCDLGEKRYRATNHHYVGGFYGASDSDAIKQELMNYGPLVMSFEPKEDFMYYKSGIYRSGPNKIHQEWEQVDHAVLLAGFGHESGQAYWTLQNSWGADWGESGYFRMARGIDESGCESIAVAAEVTEDSSNPVLDDFLASL